MKAVKNIAKFIDEEFEIDEENRTIVCRVLYALNNWNSKITLYVNNLNSPNFHKYHGMDLKNKRKFYRDYTNADEFVGYRKNNYFVAIGVAKCHTDDIFDLEFGKALAKQKALNRMSIGFMKIYDTLSEEFSLEDVHGYSNRCYFEEKQLEKELRLFSDNTLPFIIKYNNSIYIVNIIESEEIRPFYICYSKYENGKLDETNNICICESLSEFADKVKMYCNENMFETDAKFQEDFELIKNMYIGNNMYILENGVYKLKGNNGKNMLSANSLMGLFLLNLLKQK